MAPDTLYNSLVKKTIDERKPGKRRKIALVMVTYKSNKDVLENFSLLEKQTARENFDVILVYGQEDEKISCRQQFGVVHIFRATNSGPAGGFFIGERFSLDNGYEKIIHVESDAIPLSENVIEELDKQSEGGFAAVPMMHSTDRSMLIPSYMHQYCCVPASAFRKVGLTYVPMNFGGEDSGLFERIRKFCGIKVVDGVFVRHPTFSRVAKPSRTYQYVRGPLVSVMPWLSYWKFNWFVFRELLTSLIYRSFSPKTCNDSLRAIRDIFNAPDRLPFPSDSKSEEYGIAGEKFGGKLPDYDLFFLQLTGNANPDEYMHMGLIDKKKLRVLGLSSFAQRIASRISMLFESAGKRIISNQISPLFPILSSSFCIVECNQIISFRKVGLGGRLTVILAHIAIPLLFLASAAFTLACFIFIRPKWQKEIMGYGLREGERIPIK